jgi:Mlc titration factor MtfA (ptsG expression regulator)
MFNWIKNFLSIFFEEQKKISTEPLTPSDKQFLLGNVNFYNNLNETEKRIFEQRILLFLETTEIIGHDLTVAQEDRLLIASGAIILVWKFPKWHYFNLNTISLVSGSFNEKSQFGKPDSNIQGLVGTGYMKGKMILSKPALNYGFSNNRDKKNVVLHEFAHLIDIADGEGDGFPERISNHLHSIPWIEQIYEEITLITNKQSNIRDYAATNPVEFFAVATEFFFEQPQMLARKHPKVYEALSKF